MEYVTNLACLLQVGIYSNDADNQYFPYVRPQESGTKGDIRWWKQTDAAGFGFMVKALATGNPYIKEKMDLDIQVSKLKLMKANHTSQKYRLEDNIAKHYPQQITILKERISGMQADIPPVRYKL